MACEVCCCFFSAVTWLLRYLTSPEGNTLREHQIKLQKATVRMSTRLSSRQYRSLRNTISWELSYSSVTYDYILVWMCSEDFTFLSTHHGWSFSPFVKKWKLKIVFNQIVSHQLNLFRELVSDSVSCKLEKNVNTEILLTGFFVCLFCFYLLVPNVVCVVATTKSQIFLCDMMIGFELVRKNYGCVIINVSICVLVCAIHLLIR